ARLVDVTTALPLETLLHVTILDPLMRLLALHPAERVVVLVDALEECAEHPGVSIQGVLPRSTDAGVPTNLRLVMTSPPGAHLAQFPERELLPLDEGGANRRASRNDTRAYVDRRLSEPPLSLAAQRLAALELDALRERIVDSA